MLPLPTHSPSAGGSDAPLRRRGGAKACTGAGFYEDGAGSGFTLAEASS